ncbi:hypothetical protein KIPB_015832, partial [Kipferlia bialata]
VRKGLVVLAQQLYAAGCQAEFKGVVDCFQAIAKTDFPVQWSTLLDELFQYMEGTIDQRIVSLTLLEVVVRRFREEERSDNLWSVINYTGDKLAPRVLAIMQVLPLSLSLSLYTLCP